MAKIGRPGLSPEKRAELWERWKSGQCASDIARSLERTKGAIHHVLAFKGGIAPVARRRGPAVLVLDEREEISRGIAAGLSIRGIAAGLGRSPSTVSREVARHGGRSTYRAIEADGRAWELALRPKPCRLASHRRLRWRVAEKLALDWSPEQISGWLKREFLPTRACGCPTKPSIAVYLSRLVACSRKNCLGIFGRGGVCAIRKVASMQALPRADASPLNSSSSVACPAQVSGPWLAAEQWLSPVPVAYPEEGRVGLAEFLEACRLAAATALLGAHLHARRRCSLWTSYREHGGGSRMIRMGRRLG